MIANSWPQPGQFIDFRDRDNTWQVAIVLTRNQQQIKVRCEGWCQKRDEILDLLQDNSENRHSRIKPFRSMVRGYTGLQKSAGVRQHWKFSTEDISLRLLKFQQFTLNITKKQSEDVIQYMRGEHYFYMDFLMTNSYARIQDLQKVYSYFGKHIAFVNAYLSRFLQQGVINWLQLINDKDKAEDDNWERTLAQCYYELLDGIYTIAGLYDRLSIFFRANQNNIKQVVGECQTHLNYIAEQFTASKLVQSAKKVFKQLVTVVTTPSVKIKLPLPFVFSIFQLYMSIERSFELLQKGSSPIQQILDQLMIVIDCSFEQLQSQDMKNFQIQKQIDFLLSHMKPIYAKQNKRNISQWLQITRVKVCILLIKCDKLDRRIRGITRLKDYCQLSMREDGEQNENSSKWRELLANSKCFQLLYLQNDHVEIFRKSTDLSHTLYRCKIIGVDELRYIWTNSITKHSLIVKQLLIFWAGMSYYIAQSDLPSFVSTIQQYINAQTSSQLTQFYFDFIICLLKNYQIIKSKHQNCQQYENMVHRLIIKGYGILFGNISRQNIYVLIERYRKAVSIAPSSTAVIQQLFCYLGDKKSLELTLYLLNQIYSHPEYKNPYFPGDFRIILDCLKNVQKSSVEITLILKLTDKIAAKSKPTATPLIVQNQQFKQLWQYFMTASEECKSTFYDWILPSKKHEYHEIQHYINTTFSEELKQYIFVNILSNDKYIDYQVSLSKKQVQIILQFLVFVNISQLKIQRKGYLNSNKNVLRLKGIQVTGEDMLWKILEHCKQLQTAILISKYLIYFHFHFEPAVASSTRRQKAKMLMDKLLKYFQQGYASMNQTLLRNALLLYRQAIDIVKEEKNYHEQQNSNLSKIKIQVFYQGKPYPLEVNYEDKLSVVKIKIMRFLKISQIRHKLLTNKQQLISYQMRDVPIYCISDRIFRVYSIKQEQPLCYIILLAIDKQMEHKLVTMLELQNINNSVFAVIDQIQFKSDKLEMLMNINTILAKHSQENKLSKLSIFYHLLQVKIYDRFIEQSTQIDQYFLSPEFNRVLDSMNHPIEYIHHITLLNKICKLILSLLCHNPHLPHKLNLAQRCFNVMYQCCEFQLKHRAGQNYNKHLLMWIFEKCIYFIEKVKQFKNMLFFLSDNGKFIQMMEKIFIHPNLSDIRDIMTQKINKYLAYDYPINAHYVTIQQNMLNIFINMVYFKIKDMHDRKLQICNKGITQFYHILSTLIGKAVPAVFYSFIMEKQGERLSLFDTIKQVLEQVKSQKNNYNELLCGHFQVLTAIYQSKPELVDSDIVNYLLRDCLALSSQSMVNALCKDSKTVASAFKLLDQILTSNKSLVFSRLTMSTLQLGHSIKYWRNQTSWSISIKFQAKQKYRGLTNPGCICYMNSLLQQLFMIQQFRIAIINIQDLKKLTSKEMESETDKGWNQDVPGEFMILKSLKDLFLKLLYSEENTINPITFARTLKTNDKRPLVKINEQMDIDEFESILFDKVEQGLTSLGQRNFIKQLFGGVYAHQIISKECSHTSEREQEFISISLQVKKSIQQSFSALVKIQKLDGQNKYFCEKCDKKVKAQKMQTLKKLPPYLILSLKRFQFNYDIDSKIKINDYCEFTNQLKLKQYSQQQFTKKASDSIIDQSQQSNTTKQLPQDYFDYKLKGVVVHTGSADSGHYYSFIENGQNQWYQFNDEDVLLFDPAKMAEEAFGSRQNYQECKIRNAYLLIYQRVSQRSINFGEIEQEVVSQEQNKFIIDKICQRNREIHKYELIFSSEYEQLVERISKSVGSAQVDSSTEQEWYGFVLSYYLLVKFRRDGLQQLIKYSQQIQTMIKHRFTFCIAFLTLFTSCSFIEQFYIYNPIRQKCKILSSLLFTALITYFQPLQNMNDFVKNQLLNKVLLCIKIIFSCHAPIHELVIALRKFVQYLIKEQSILLVLSIINHYSFEMIIFDHLFGFAVSIKKRKDIEDVQLLLNKQNNQIPFLYPTSFDGKKYYPNSTCECWRLFSSLIKINNRMSKDTHYFQQMIKINKQNNQESFKIVSSIFYAFGVKQQTIQRQFDNLMPQKITPAIFECYNFRGIYYMFDCFKQFKAVNRLIDALEKGLKQYESSKYRSFMFIIELIIHDADTTEQQIQKLMQMLQKVYKHNQKYFLQIDLLNQWIHKIAKESDLFIEVLQQKRQFVEWIIQWTSKMNIPNLDTLKKHRNPSCERLMNRLHGIVVSSESKDYEINHSKMKKDYQDILALNISARQRTINVSDDYQIGSILEYFDSSTAKWRRVQFIDNHFGYMTLLKNGKEDVKICMWEDSQKLRIPEVTVEDVDEESIESVEEEESQSQSERIP